jgi:hypothetical protein
MASAHRLRATHTTAETSPDPQTPLPTGSESPHHQIRATALRFRAPTEETTGQVLANPQLSQG